MGLGDWFGKALDKLNPFEILGKVIDRNQGKADARHQEAVQREFAQHGLRWKVKDAQMAGIHPLAALGASTMSYSPVQVGGSGWSDFGQDFGRAISATSTARERLDQEANPYGTGNSKLDALVLERSVLQNDLLREQVLQARDRRLAQTGPPFPEAGVTPAAYVPASGSHVAGPGLSVGRGSAPASGAIKIDPGSVVSRSPSDPSTEAGSTPAWKLYEMLPGQSVYLPGASASEPLETLGSPAALAAVIAKNAHVSAEWVGRKLFGRDKPPSSLLLPGHQWQWSVMSQSWTMVRVPNWTRSLGR